MKRTPPVLILAMLFGMVVPAAAQEPEPGFLGPVPASRCRPESGYEKTAWNRFASSQVKACERLHFSYGPITIKPGQNDVLLGPVTIEKPWYDGYITRFKPDLVDASGTAPPIDQVHLHHGTWLNGSPQYGNGPFFAAGEEKTTIPFPKGYGMHVGASDTWLLLYMVHNNVSEPTEVWITYDVDFIPDADAEKAGIVPTKPIWLDVQREPIARGAPDTSGNPVFNVQKGFGHHSKHYGQRVCSWPDENCARQDVYDDRTPQQGKPVSVPGADWKVPKSMAGTIVMMGGHLHPGGLDDTVSLVRDGKEKVITHSDALYWGRKNPKVANGPATSWDFSMAGTGAFVGWKVKTEPGDILRLNATYDSQKASWYENMGIVMAWVAPKDPHKPEGIDVFDDNVRLDPGVSTMAARVPGYMKPSCTPDSKGPRKTLCLRGQITHGHLREASHFGGCGGHHGTCQKLPKGEGPLVDEIHMSSFTYGEADMGVVGATGIPRVKKGEPVRFWNGDTAANIWHTVTRCEEPCTGAMGIDYPLASGGFGKPSDKMDFDSGQIGYGVFFSPASGQIGGHKPWDEQISDGAFWDFTPTKTGTYTFFCRIHMGMRGVIKVVK
jgi:plastocyanin